MNNEKRRKQKRVAVWISILISLLSILIIGSILHNFVFLTNEIEIEGNLRYAREEIILASEIETGAPLYSMRKSETVKKILAACPYVEKVIIKRDLPSRIRIIVSESEPMCISELYGEYFVLDAKLRVLEYSAEKYENTDLVKLVLPETKRAMLSEKVVLAGELDSKYITDALEMISQSELYPKIKEISAESKFDIYVIYDGIYRIKFGSVKDMDIKLDVAQAIIESGKLDRDTRLVIDVSDPNEATVMSENDLKT